MNKNKNISHCYCFLLIYNSARLYSNYVKVTQIYMIEFRLQKKAKKLIFEIEVLVMQI